MILAALAPQPLHGYGIITEVSRLSDSRLTLRPGTLYGALERLCADQLIELDRQEIVDNRLRRYYRLTTAGDAALRAETERMNRSVQAASERLRLRDASAGRISAAHRAQLAGGHA